MKSIVQFFELDEKVQEEIVRAYKNRSIILYRMDSYYTHKKEVESELNSIREMCEHPLLNIDKTWDTDEYGKMLDNGWIKYNCLDCGKSWMEEF